MQNDWSLRATATLALRSPLRLTSFTPQAFTADHFGTRVETAARSVFVSHEPRRLPPSQPEVSLQQQSTSQSLRILVVDDTVEVAQTIGWMLEEIGHDYHLVHDGRLALQAAKEYKPDAILLDIELPGMDGYEVCRAFDKDEIFKTIPIITQTGWGQDRDKALSPQQT